MSPWHLRVARDVLRRDGVVAYPTEAVYGLGCDPRSWTAVAKLLRLKRRPAGKGMILVAASLEQLAPYILPLTDDIAARVLPTWPGPFTWLLPAAYTCPRWLRGEHATIAVRVSAHAVVRELCTAFGGALVSTSANLSGRPPARSALDVRRIFGADVDYILHGPLGELARPTAIRDGVSGRVLRAG
ncbi:MAG: L-threonylcarbamoyladenylate synthase [Thiohalomonadaceae bacterium]